MAAFALVVAICCLVMARSLLLAGSGQVGAAREPASASVSVAAAEQDPTSGPTVQLLLPLSSASPTETTTPSATARPVPSKLATASSKPSVRHPRVRVHLAHSTPASVLHTTASQLVSQLRLQGQLLQQQATVLEQRASSQAADLAGTARGLAAQSMALSVQGDALVDQADKLATLAGTLGPSATDVLAGQVSDLADQVSTLANQAADLASQVSDLSDQVDALPPEPSPTDSPSPDARGTGDPAAAAPQLRTAPLATDDDTSAPPTP